MEKTRILAIAPYDGMRIALMEVAAQRPDVDLMVHVGDLEDGARIVASISPDQYDVIISRGGTAERIRANVGLPVVEIALSAYDILRALHLSQNFTGRYAIVGYPAITDSAYLLRDLMNSQLEIITIHSPQEAQTVLSGLSEKGYRMVIGDMITSTLATQANLSSILITSGAESIENTLDAAVQQHRSSAMLKTENKLLREVIARQHQPVLILDANARVILDTTTAKEHEVRDALRRELPSVRENERYTFVRKGKENQFLIHAQWIDLGPEAQFAAFSINHVFAADDSGIRYLDAETLRAESLQSFAAIGLQSEQFRSQLDRYRASSLPVVLCGETGTGRDSLAALLYLESDYTRNAFVSIDCLLVKEKGWKHLLSSTQSPLLGTGQMVFFRNCHALQASHAQQLAEYIQSAPAARHNRMLFSFSIDAQAEKNDILYAALLERMTTVQLTLAPLRDSMHEIHNLISLCISSLNAVLGKQIIGMEEEAVRLVQHFPWPENYVQLKRVITKAMLLTNESVISAKILRDALRDETALTPPSLSVDTLITSGLTLDSIEKAIVSTVLAQENGNQTNAAKRLGISRSTLWRMLK